MSGGPSSPTSPSATTKAASAPRAPKSIVKKGRPDIAAHAQRIPHFVKVGGRSLQLWVIYESFRFEQDNQLPCSLPVSFPGDLKWFSS
ncbi:hypothetical protein B0J18DRAFT_237776 [Chaetomium sp. MPI-SDFR-AT-0129]|nr:hypothetical protein B0J18DRAFT_237776 [Chaetomium sp. MPI-SDFR-AT-0129]